ncbi:hypothetical protein A2480_03230 [Candidatus Uhrbacteria bacterium RIFOXYC2_FULL_47_19]|uniref:Peptidase M10 metallopeptidase domain-containing protein n=1 Tax=Candidatus Uhrbacteria bacterium RIFOXYC2_FULL_47_19 TaxID=1802424 RepID=A0A1F7WDY8_9BACT|nr:MAG: hypothetical protein A2480_03230 [Candidatus Uhrbacteria bacterium RIFOXYC2_FULL_47_19]HCC22230.1 hypothetical protein [Candidatus Uhrbacteria bacterium]
MSDFEVLPVQIEENDVDLSNSGIKKEITNPTLQSKKRRIVIRWIWLVIVVVVVGLVWWWFGGNVCSLPIEYRIGHYDERFDISKEEFLMVLSEAELKWESATGQDLLRYNANSTEAVAVNLVFDDRQVATQELERLKFERDGLESEIGSIADEYQKLRSVYDAREASIAELKTYYEEQLQLFELTVRAWNTRGGASRDVYDELLREQSRLDNYVSDLNALIDEQNRQAEQLNQLAGQEQEKVVGFNAGVSRFNETFTLGEDDEQGIYSSGTINVYQFDNREDLVMLLMHEFGHALGLGHDSDPQSIMFPRKNEQQDDGDAYISSGTLQGLFRRCNLH